MDAGGLDPQQVLERERVAPFLQRKHHFARVEQHDVLGQVVDRLAADRLGHHRLGVSHADIADHDKGSPRRARQCLQPRGTGAGAQHHHPPLEDVASERPAEQDPEHQQQDDGEPHRVEQVGAPEGDRGDQEEQRRQRDRAQRNGNDQPGGGKAQRLERLRPIDADRDHREFQGRGEAQQFGNARLDRLCDHADLPGAHDPAQLRRHQQQREVQHPEQQHGMGYVVLEQPDHDARFPGRA